jgi:serine/threonine protein kinase
VVVAVLELCDLGTLRRALGERAAFAPTSRHGPRAAYRALLRTAQEVARGLDALHSAGVVHGDVSPSNVLLRAHRADRRGFVAKLADFGHAAPAGARVGGRVGAPAYAAPEKLAAGVGGPPSDVYALGVVLNALWCGREPYAGLHGAEVAVGVVSGGLRPAWTRPGAPPPLVALAEACWAGDPVARPTAAAVAAALADVEAAFRRQAK